MKKLVLLTLFLSLLIVTQSTHAYTSSGGVELNDVVLIDYILTVDGEIEDQAQNWQTEVSDRLVVGFYEGLIGMKVDTEKSFDVQPHEGYTDESYGLYGKILHFEVYLISIVRNIRDNPDGDSGVSDVLKNTSDVGIMKTDCLFTKFSVSDFSGGVINRQKQAGFNISKPIMI